MARNRNRCYGDENNPPDFHSALRYDEHTGKFYWTRRVTSSRNPGEGAGSKNTDGGIIIEYDGRRWHASRLAWYFIHGSFPRLLVDHINGDRGDNRKNNLREVSLRENNQNKKVHRNGRLVGTYRRPNGKWSAKIKINLKTFHLGTYDTEQEAADKYQEALACLDEGVR